MRIGATPYFPQQTPYQANRTPAGSTDDNQLANGSAASSYDFSNMTRPELRDAIASLTKNGQMSFQESSSLVPLAGSAALTYAGSGAPSADYDTAHLNLFSMLKDGLAGAKSRHDDKSAAAFQQTLSALQRLQGTLAGVDLKV
jgi:hypothetical protein